MNAEQKQRAKDALQKWHSSNDDSLREYQSAELMAALLQDLVDAPEPEPFGYFKPEPFGWTDCAETDDGAIALYELPPAPSVPDGWRLVPYTPTVLMLERAGYAVNNRPQPSKYEPSATPAIIFWTAMLNYAPEAPTPAEAPAQDFEDALEQAFWDFDARHKGYKKTIRPISERDAFKQVLRNFMHEHGGAEAPADVARDAARLDWLDAQCSENNGRHICCLPGGLRVAIDAAMSEKGQS